MSLHERCKMPNRPDHAKQDAGSDGSPALLKRFCGITRPADFLSKRTNKEE